MKCRPSTPCWWCCLQPEKWTPVSDGHSRVLVQWSSGGPPACLSIGCKEAGSRPCSQGCRKDLHCIPQPNTEWLTSTHMQKSLSKPDNDTPIHVESGFESLMSYLRNLNEDQQGGSDEENIPVSDSICQHLVCVSIEPWREQEYNANWTDLYGQFVLKLTNRSSDCGVKGLAWSCSNCIVDRDKRTIVIIMYK